MRANSKAARLVRTMPTGSPDRQKWLGLRVRPEQDAATPEIQHLAGLLDQLANTDDVRFCMLALCLARDCIRYQSDTERTGGEDIAGVTRPATNALEALERGADDCDAKAVLFTALCLAKPSRALRAELADWWDPATGALAHVSGLVWLNGQWTHAETILARARLGESFHSVPPEEQSGEWRYS